MSRTKVPNTDHAYLRAAERCGWSKTKARTMMMKASKYGKSYGQIKDKKIADYIKARQVSTRRRIKYYCGYVFVFASTSTRCYTVYEYKGDDTNGN